MTAVALDIVALVLIVASAVAFFFGADAITTHKDVVALYWLIIGIVLVRAGTQLGRRDRATA